MSKLDLAVESICVAVTMIFVAGLDAVGVPPRFSALGAVLGALAIFVWYLLSDEDVPR